MLPERAAPVAPTSDPRDVPARPAIAQHEAVARQRVEQLDVPASATAGHEVLDRTADAFVRASGPAPGQLVTGLQHADHGTRARLVQRLQAGIGNAAVGGMLTSRRVRATPLHSERRAGDEESHATVQREEGDLPSDGAIPLDTTAAAGASASETIGPPTPSTYAVQASNLADVLAAIGGRDEAGHVGWAATPTYAANTNTKVDTANVNVDISIEMPSWTPPASMLPKARAEWTRWYAALDAHEQGHVTKVHSVYDGLARKMIGKTLAGAATAFKTADDSAQPTSDAYDKSNDHGLLKGTVLDVGIETLELDEEQKKKAAAAKPQGHEATVPEVPGDE